MTNVIELKDKDNEIVYPVTAAEGVYMSNGQNIKVVIENIEEKIIDGVSKENTKINVNTIIL